MFDSVYRFRARWQVLGAEYAALQAERQRMELEMQRGRAVLDQRRLAEAPLASDLLMRTAPELVRRIPRGRPAQGRNAQGFRGGGRPPREFRFLSFVSFFSLIFLVFGRFSDFRKPDYQKIEEVQKHFGNGAPRR